MFWLSQMLSLTEFCAGIERVDLHCVREHERVARIRRSVCSAAHDGRRSDADDDQRDETERDNRLDDATSVGGQ